MKKFSAALCLVIGLALFTFSGCRADVFTDKSFSSGENEIKSVFIDVSDRQIEISVSEDEQVHIDYCDGKKEFLDIDVSDDGILTAKLAFNKHWTDFIGAKPSAEYRKIKIEIPYGIENLKINTTNENIGVSEITVKDTVSLSANGGNITFIKLNASKKLFLNAKNGNIEGTVIGGMDDYAIKCEYKKGDCNLPAEKNDGNKLLTANCNNGNIKIEFIK